MGTSEEDPDIRATVSEEMLSDGSVAYKVIWTGWAGDVVEIEAEDRAHAERIAEFVEDLGFEVVN